MQKNKYSGPASAINEKVFPRMKANDDRFGLIPSGGGKVPVATLAKCRRDGFCKFEGHGFNESTIPLHAGKSLIGNTMLLFCSGSSGGEC